MKFNKRTQTCGELNISNEGTIVTLNGWVSKKRDLGGILFIDLRDRYGITQLKVVPEKKELFENAVKLGNEFVISATGKVIKRFSVNKNLPTGDIEIDVDELEVINESESTPFVIEDDIKASDELRLEFRYLDLRRKRLQDNLIMRSKAYNVVRNYFHDLGFIEVETPILMKSTPEGARDYLVPSRVQKGKFYALPQSPQIYKQILMVSGFDKYIQICKCFRDEDLRADRQPEFTQIDMEMSFVTHDDVFTVDEGLMQAIWKDALGYDLQAPFKRMTYVDCMKYYGSDKPDLRVKGDMKIEDLSSVVSGSGFKVFDDALNSKGIVAGIKLSFAENKIEVSRKVIDGLTEYVKTLGFGGLGYIKYNADGTVQSPLLKFLSDDIQKSIKGSFNAINGELIFILSGERNKVLTGLGQLRLKLAEDFKLIDESIYEFLWVTDFPLFHYDEKEGRFVAEHHVFTMPKSEDLEKFERANNEPENRIEIIRSIRGDCYDLVLNGMEFASGSIRIHRRDIQEKVFDVIGLSKEEQDQKFGFLLEAFQYGAPPHGGTGLGFDRIVATLCGLKGIRDVIAFPKTSSATSLMDDCPSVVTDEQLKELGITVTTK
ncbi:aspartate--tRNA ligase [soil metagenome]